MRANNSEIECLNIRPTRVVPNLSDDVRDGLLNRPRSLSPKYFYDAKGSDLFTRICDTPEYYPTRTEENLLNQFSNEIISLTKAQHIVELGSGNAQKTRNLFEACESLAHICSYAPFDVCEEILVESSEALKQEYPWLAINPLLGDFHAGLGNLPDLDGRRLFIFLGGSIGNFTPPEAKDFLIEVYDNAKVGDYLLLGADRKKEHQVLNAAYNDAEGITAEFNLNILNVLNNELDADFNTDDFEHAAHFNDSLDRIEMHLVSKKEQRIEIEHLDESLQLQKGETILTEISCKYTYENLEDLLCGAGFTIQKHYQPTNQYFSLVLVQKQ